MKKVIAIYYEEDREKRLGNGYGDGFVFELENGERVYTMSTDVVAHHVTKTVKGSMPKA